MPFERDKLFLSVVSALGHRRDAVSASTALSSTITLKIIDASQMAVIDRAAICQIVVEVLEAFDGAAAVQYRAYHME